MSKKKVRPPKNLDDLKIEIIRLRCSAYERDIAKSEEISMSDFIPYCINKEINRRNGFLLVKDYLNLKNNV